MENTNNTPDNENRIIRFFKSIVDAVSFANANKDKQPKVGGSYATKDYYVSFLNPSSDE